MSTPTTTSVPSAGVESSAAHSSHTPGDSISHESAAMSVHWHKYSRRASWRGILRDRISRARTSTDHVMSAPRICTQRLAYFIGIVEIPMLVRRLPVDQEPRTRIVTLEQPTRIQPPEQWVGVAARDVAFPGAGHADSDHPSWRSPLRGRRGLHHEHPITSTGPLGKFVRQEQRVFRSFVRACDRRDAIYAARSTISEQDLALEHLVQPAQRRGFDLLALRAARHDLRLPKQLAGLDVATPRRSTRAASTGGGCRPGRPSPNEPTRPRTPSSPRLVPRRSAPPNTTSAPTTPRQGPTRTNATQTPAATPTTDTGRRTGRPHHERGSSPSTCRPDHRATYEASDSTSIVRSRGSSSSSSSSPNPSLSFSIERAA